MSLRPWVSGILALTGILMLTGQASAPGETACWEELDQDIDPLFGANRYVSNEARDEILTLLVSLRERFQETAPVCTGKGVELEILLLILNGRLSEAVHVADTFLEGPGQATSIRSRINIAKDRGYALIHMGELREGAQSYYAAAALADQTEPLRGAWILIAAASISRSLGDLNTTAKYLEGAQAILQKAEAADELQVSKLIQFEAQAWVNKALLAHDRMVLHVDGPQRDSLTLAMERRANRALRTYDRLRGRQDWHATDPRNYGFRAFAHNQLALAAAYRGHHDLALRRIDAAFPLAREGRTSYPVVLMETYIAQATLARLRGDREAERRATEEVYREAIELGEAGYEAGALETLGRLAEDEQDWAEATRRYTTAIELRERQRERLGLQDWSALVFSVMQDGYRGLARVQVAQGRHEEAFWTLDRTRGRYLLDLRRHLAVRDRLTPLKRAEADSVQTALTLTRKELNAETLTAGQQARLIARASRLQEQLDELVGPLDAEDQTRSHTVHDLQSRLRARDQVLVSYLLSPERSLAFVVRPDTLVTVDLKTTPAEIRALLHEAGSPWRDDASADPAFSLDALHQLYQSVVAPVRPWVPAGASLLVVPDGPMAALPFAMLTTARSTDYAEAPYLVRDLAVTTELAAALVVEPNDAIDHDLSLDLLAYGRSAFSTGLASWEGTAPLDDLPHVDDELQRISRYVGSRRVALNEEATEADLSAHLGTARIVHIASHAEPNAVLPLYSRIALWDGPSDADDGVVYLYELQGRSLPADLVVLSGCSTARGEARAGEGMIGLQYAVRSAGARASLATLWPVDDEASVDLMGGFYEGLRDGLTKERALQRAQVAYIDANEGLDASPFFWAAPVLSGDTSPVPLAPGGPSAWWLGALLALAGGGVAWHLRQRAAHA